METTIYCRLAHKEEGVEREFGAAYRAYKARTDMLLPTLLRRSERGHEWPQLTRL
jgi:protein-S-isoprenylcysteine O-methyltransferase Ste14